jgi:hypothetical protein
VLAVVASACVLGAIVTLVRAIAADGSYVVSVALVLGAFAALAVRALVTAIASPPA